MIPQLLPQMNYAINKVLQYDLVAQKKLREMEGRSLCWVVQDWGLTMVFKVVDGELIIDDRMQSCQATVEASPQELFELWRNYDADVSINLQMSGNPLALQDFSQLFKSLNIDWEALLEEVFGTFGAHVTGQVVHKVGAKVARTLHRIGDDIRAYKRDEMGS